MSLELQIVLWAIGVLVAIAVPLMFWIINSIVGIRAELARQDERIKHLNDAVRLLTRALGGRGEKALLDSYADDSQD